MNNFYKLAVVTFFVASLMCSCSQKSAQVNENQKAEALAQIDQTKLVGKWLRPDGGYILDIRGVTDDGKLEAGYFNPNPINISEATWRRSDELGLVVFVELRDQGYPGATYRLHYSATDDKLTGAYHQPTHGETFSVDFVRQ